MRVLVLATTLDKPEAAIFAGLKHRGVDVHVVGTPLPEHRQTLSQAGISVTDFSFRNRFDLGGMRLIRRLTREYAPHIVYALSNRALSATVISLYFHSVKIVAYRGTVGHISWFDPSSWFTYLNSRVTKTLCVSKAVEAYLLEVGIPQRRLVTVYKGHDVDWYRGASVPPRDSLGIPSDAFVVGCTAMMRPVKGIDDLLRSVAALLDELPKLHLLLVGSVKDPAIQGEIDRFPDQSRIHLTGFRHDATALARVADVTVMASKNREGFPKSMIESMSQGVPAIVTAVGGMPELVDDGNAGLLVPPSDPAALAAAIRTLYHDAALRERLGVAAHQRIASAFNINQTITQMHAVFEELV